MIPRTSVISCITFETKTESLSLIINESRYACFVRMSMMAFAAATAVGFDTGNSKAYLENTSISVKRFAYSPVGGSFDSRAICMTSSGHELHLAKLMSWGVISELSIFLSWT